MRTPLGNVQHRLVHADILMISEILKLIFPPSSCLKMKASIISFDDLIFVETT